MRSTRRAHHATLQEASPIELDCNNKPLINQPGVAAWLANNGGAQVNAPCPVLWTTTFSDNICEQSAPLVTFTATDAAGNAASSTVGFVAVELKTEVYAILRWHAPPPRAR